MGILSAPRAFPALPLASRAALLARIGLALSGSFAAGLVLFSRLLILVLIFVVIVRHDFLL